MNAVRICRRGLLVVFSSPSGAGKTTITRRLVERDPGLMLSVSVTTRPMRPGEVDGRDYWFITPQRFDQMMAEGELLEHACVFGHHYGTPRQPIDVALPAGRDVVADLDWQGTQQLADKLGKDLVAVFILPPSFGALGERLHRRAQDTDPVVAGRMAKSAEEISHWSEYDYIIINEQLDDAVAKAHAIVVAERLRRTRQTGLAEFVENLGKG